MKPEYVASITPAAESGQSACGIAGVSDVTLQAARECYIIPYRRDDLSRLVLETGNSLDIAAAENLVHRWPADEVGNSRALAAYIGGRCWIRTPGRGHGIFDREMGLFRFDLGEQVVIATAVHLARLRADLRGLPPEEWKSRAAFAVKMATERAIRACISIASNASEVFRLDRELDARDDWINCRGLAVPLRHGLSFARPATPEDLFTRSTCPVERGPTPVFDKFIKEISCDRDEWCSWLLRFLGYALTGDTAAAFLVELFGLGRNGKGALKRLLKKIFGSYFGTLASSVVLKTRSDGAGPRPDLCDLDGIRLACIPEVQAGRLDLQIIKIITGGDDLTASRKFRDTFTFTPRAKVFIETNTEQDLDRVDDAIRARIRKVPFDFSVVGREDPAIEDRLAAEAPAILARLIDEAGEYYRLGPGPRGFPFSPSIMVATENYLASQDIVGRWVEEKTEAVGATKASVLFRSFARWAEAEGVPPMSQRNFSRALIAAGVKRLPRSRTGIVYSPICLAIAENDEGSVQE